MLGYRFTKYLAHKDLSDTTFDQLFKVFNELLIITGGDVSEALSWLTNIDKQYNITDGKYGMGDFIEDLKSKGFISDKTPDGSFEITAKTEQNIRKNALEEIFGKLKKSGKGEHKTNFTGLGEEPGTDRRNYEFGDLLHQISMTDSLRNAQINHGLGDFMLTEDDLEVVESEYKTQTSTVLMIDISHSMILYGEDRITPAKKVAMALAELITKKYKKDTLDVIVFGNDAWQIQIKDLPYLQVGPYHTNTIAGLELAMDLLRRRKNKNKQIFMITDGKPTCMKQGIKYYKNSFGLDPKILNKTLNLGAQCKRLNIPITTFMIASDPYLQEFVKEFTTVNNGNAYYSSLQGLGNLVFEDYKKNRKKDTEINYMSYEKLTSKDKLKITTLKDLMESGYQPKAVKEELRENLIKKMKAGENVFEGIWGYEDTVIPDIQRAILSRHNINLLGLRGQAKTRIARMMILLLDEYIPVLKGTELNDDPMQPLSRQALDILEEKGNNATVAWMHRDERYTEKLATPDVSVADLIGDVDPIKAATLKLPYSDERVIHYGLIPRSHRGIFVINELPDLQARIQVALFNILQEGDIQIRGFKLRLPLDLQFVFTANPEDYTNRGSIITPLKDRIDAQIITHYPETIEIGRKITTQEAAIKDEQNEIVEVNELSKDLIEQIAIEARKSEYIDEKSGVSARLTISAYESLISAAERRSLINKEQKVYVRMSDFTGVIPSITGKVELVYEGEQEGPGIVAHTLVGKAIRSQFDKYFPNPEDLRKDREKENPYKPISKWFNDGQKIDLFHDDNEKEYQNKLERIPGLKDLVKTHHKKLNEKETYFMMEFALHGMAEYSLLSKHALANGHSFKDLLSSMLNFEDSNDNDEDFNI